MTPSRILRAGLVAGLVLTVPAVAVEPKAVTFTTEDGVEIVADFYPPEGSAAAPVAILLHMYRQDRSSWKPLIPKLHEAGFAVLAMDLRGHGGSTKPEHQKLAQKVTDRDPEVFRAMHRDVAAAYGFLAQQPNCDLSRFALVGASVGCSVAIDYAGRDRSVDAVVCLSPGTNYLGLDSVAHMKTFARCGKRPVLLMAAPGEREACDTLAGIHPGATVRIVGEGKIHGTHMFGKIKDVEGEIARFLTEHVGGSSDARVAASLEGETFFPVGSEGDKALDARTRRVFSSAQEAKDRGLKEGS